MKEGELEGYYPTQTSKKSRTEAETTVVMKKRTRGESPEETSDQEERGRKRRRTEKVSLQPVKKIVNFSIRDLR